MKRKGALSHPLVVFFCPAGVFGPLVVFCGWIRPAQEQPQHELPVAQAGFESVVLEEESVEVDFLQDEPLAV